MVTEDHKEVKKEFPHVNQIVSCQRGLTSILTIPVRDGIHGNLHPRNKRTWLSIFIIVI